MQVHHVSGRRPIGAAVAFAVAMLSFHGPTWAQEESGTSDGRPSTTSLDKVTVTGSRIKRVDIEGPSPVTVITADDIQKEGFSTVYEALATLSQFTGSVQNELNQSGFTPNAQFINLRSLGPGYQLVLLNGKRMADYPMPYNSQSNAVSLSSIPAAAVERIEIMTGGASAIYGSDAVAGVINIITKSNFEGDSLYVRGGTTTRGGGDTGLFQWTGGKTGERWNLIYALEYLNRESILASQRDFMDSYRDNPRYRDDPQNATAASGVYLYRNGAGYVWPDANGKLSGSVDALRSACAATSPDFQPYRSARNVANENRCGYFGYPATQSIQNGFDKASAYLSGTLDFGQDLQAYGQLLYTRSKNTGASATRFWQTAGWVHDPDLGYLQAQRIFTPAETGGSQKSVFKEESLSLNLGLRGTWWDGRFDWDAGISHSRYDMTLEMPYFTTDRINDYFFGDLLGYVGAARYPSYHVRVDRLFSPMSPSDYRSLITTVHSTAESQSTQGQFTLTGDLFDLPAGPVGMAFVLEGARQKYALNPDPRSATDYTGKDSIYNLTSTRGGGSRDRYALGLEFGVPILHNLKANLAGRYDRYDDQTDVDGAFTWQAGLEWRPVSSLLLRGTHATSFRAPDMHYVYAGNSGGYTYITDAYLCRMKGIDPTSPDCSGPDYNYQVFRTYEGRKDLAEEEGRSSTVGVVWDVMSQMSVSLDYYSIKLENQVGEIDSDYLMRTYADCRLGTDIRGKPVDSGSPSCTHFMGLISRDESSLGNGKVDRYSAYPVNQSMIRSDGFDVTWKYALDTDRRGKFSFQANYTHVTKLDLQRFADDEVDNIRDNRRYYSFRSRANWMVGWEKNDWQTNLYGYRYGSLPSWDESTRIAPYFLWNLDVQKKITPKATIGVSVVNVFDNLHPRDDSYTSYPYFWRAYSPVGRQVFANYRYTF